jgi:uncharacterized protein (TIGR02145 family)
MRPGKHFSKLIILGFLGLSTACKKHIPATVKDIDGNIYHTIMIGKQIWMAENLKVSRYRNGDKIPYVPGKIQWSNLTSGGYCNDENNDTVASVYGHLYNWYVAADHRNVAPEGWHVPSDDEFKALQKFLGGDSLAGGKMKETGTTYWMSPNTGATGITGFSALPAGYRDSYDGSYHLKGYTSIIWTSSAKDSCAWVRTVSYDHSEIFRNYIAKSNGLSIRCIKD